MSSSGREIGGNDSFDAADSDYKGKGPKKSSRESRRATRREPRGPKKTRPLDAVMLRDLALSYAARFATTGAKLEQYLARKIRTRGMAEDEDGRTGELDVTGLVTQMIDLGYVNDDAYARARSRDLTSRGYGARRVEQALWAAGVEEDLRQSNAPGEAESRRAAVLLAKKRRFGPFGRKDHGDGSEHVAEDENGDPLERRKLHEKQVAAMLRAGHQYDHVRFILDAAGIAEVEQWLCEAEADEHAGESSMDNRGGESDLW